MQIARDLAGFSMGRSDLLRRAMSKKKSEEMEKEGNAFLYGETDENGNVIIDGALRRGLDLKTAQEIWDLMREFAKYAFNKSHAASYAVVACQTAWLKYYYPAEFYAALLSSVMDQESKIYRYIDDCNKRKIQVLPPDINRSDFKFTVDDHKIIFGLGAIKSVGSNLIESIISARNKDGDFSGLYDFCERVEGVHLKTLLNLIKAGAFDFTGLSREELLINAPEMLKVGQENRNFKNSGQTSFFQMLPELTHEPELKQVAEPLDKELILAMEKEVLGIYLSGHPLKKYEALIDSQTDFNFKILDNFEDLSSTVRDQSTVKVAGLIESVKTQITKNNEVMSFCILEDQYSHLDLVIFPKTYEKYKNIIVKDSPVLVTGKICYNENLDVSIVVDTIKLLDQLKNEIENRVEIRQNTLTINFKSSKEKAKISQIKELLKTSPGNMPVILFFQKEQKRFKASDRLRINPTEELKEKINQLLNNS